MSAHLLKEMGLVLLIGAILSCASAQDDLDDLIDQVFKPPSGNTQPGGEEQPRIPQENNNNNPLDCECVPYYLCQNNTIITNGVGLIDIRSAFTSSLNTRCSCPGSQPSGLKDGPCPNYLDVCCQPPNRVTEPITPKPEPRPVGGCGRRNPDGVGFRITGANDNEAQFGEFPWMVAVLRIETLDKSPEKLNVYQCGGALIHMQVVLTAAHCVASLTEKQSLRIRAGEWDTQTKNELFPHQDRSVTEVVVHPEYYSGALYNDVALLFLDTPVDAAENVDIICLPQPGTIFDHSRCFASGWGKDVFGKEGKYQVILKKVELPVVRRDTCEAALRNTRLGQYFKLHQSFICAGGEPNKDTCKGDGGSPLVCPLPNNPAQYAQAGIVAWGIGCGENNTPGVYVNVAMFHDWIQEQIAYQGLNPTQYS